MDARSYMVCVWNINSIQYCGHENLKKYDNKIDIFIDYFEKYSMDVDYFKRYCSNKFLSLVIFFLLVLVKTISIL